MTDNSNIKTIKYTLYIMNFNFFMEAVDINVNDGLN